ncbi:MAG: endonuclease/exonuclease/phosphatase family protein [Burkholderiaceae bacterium]|jgi:endonuclease/exonuclease/phosphatase family metal-dependent hydrolase
MQIVSYNIQFGTGRDEKVDLARIADTVRGADLIALQEVERHAKRTGMVDQAAVLASLLPEYYWVYGPGMDLSADVMGPGGQPFHRRRQFGNMLLSKTPILTARNHLLPKMGTLEQFSLQRCALEGVIHSPKGKALRAMSVHLSHLSDADREPQVARLLDIHQRAYYEGPGWCGTKVSEAFTEGHEAAPMPREALIMGDFNFSWRSPLYDRIVGPLSDAFGRMPYRDGLIDSWVAAGHREDEGCTCHSGSVADGERIDYCFVSSELSKHLSNAWIDEDSIGSDHQAIWIDMDV